MAAFAEAAVELGYTVLPERGAEVTGLELRRDNELLLLRVHDGGLVNPTTRAWRTRAAATGSVSSRKAPRAAACCSLTASSTSTGPTRVVS